MSVIQQFVLEADTDESLHAACIIALQGHSRASHYKQFNEDDGSVSLRLVWLCEAGYTKLPYCLETPDEMFEFLKCWLKKEGKYPTKMPNTDGDVVKGYRVVSSYSDVISIKPTFIVYGK